LTRFVKPLFSKIEALRIPLMPTAARSRSNAPDETKRRVLDAAAAAFQARGYHSTTTHEILRDAAVTAGAMHHHFPTKKSIGLAVVRERVSLAVKQTWIEPVRSARSGPEGVRQVLAAIAHTLDKRGSVLGCPLSNLAIELSLADPDFRSEIQDVFDGWQRAIADKFRADRKSGDLRQGDPDELATFVVAAYSGAMAIAKARQDSLPLKSCAKQLATLFEDHASRPSVKAKSLK
jgi:AcrR family transcriptional regulator